MKDQKIPEKPADDQLSSGSEGSRREFLSKSGAAAFGLALSSLYGVQLVNAQTKTATTRVKAVAPVQAGTFRISQNEAGRLNAIQKVVLNGMQTGNIKAAISRYGAGLSSNDRRVLGSLTARDLQDLAEIKGKIADRIGPGPVGFVGVVAW